jgi:hypothetical protein
MPRVGVPELALDDDRGYACSGHFEGVGVAELVRREASAHPLSRRGREGWRGQRLVAMVDLESAP